MKTAHLVVGIVLVILGVLLGIFSLSLLGATCAENPVAAAILGLPTCDQVVTQIFAIGAGGLLFLIIGIVVLATGKEKQIPQAAPVQGPEPGYVLCPACRGQNYSAAVHCQWCGEPMKVET